jgi:glycosyltransferase involved in cell wall biosynthesis
MASVVLVASFSTVPRTLRMAKTLAEDGHSVTILEWDRECSRPSSESRGNVSFRRLGVKAPYGRWAAVLFPVWLGFVLINLVLRRYDVVQPQNLDNLIPVYLASKTRRFKIVYDLADFYADAYLVGVPLLAYLSQATERLLVRNVDGLILMSEKQLVQIGRNNVPNRWTVIYNSPDDAVQPDAVRDDRTYSTLIVFYGGVLARERLKLLTVMKVAADMHGVDLLIAGFGEYEQLVENVARRLPNVQFLGRLAHRDIMQLSSQAHVILIPFDASYANVQVALPNKFFEGLALAKPVMVPVGTYMAELCSKFRFGLSVDYDDEEDVRRTLLRLQDSDLRDELSRNAASTYARLFDSTLMKRRYAQFYRDILLDENSTVERDSS